MSISKADPLQEFISGSSVGERWTAARKLMASKELLSIADTVEFKQAFIALGKLGMQVEGIERLVAIDLLVRISSFAKKLKTQAAIALAHILDSNLPPLAQIGDAQNLPPEAKAAEIRENVAAALEHASGEWVIPYVIQSLLEEDRSQRCRLELTRQLAKRETSVYVWLTHLAKRAKLQKAGTDGMDNAIPKLKDISAALAEIIRNERVRLTVSPETGSALSQLVNAMIYIPVRADLPKRLDIAAAEVSGLLDELLSAQPDLITQPDMYAIIADFEKWWGPLPYSAALMDALMPVVKKIISGITLLARMGQRSDGLLSRFRQATGSPKEVQHCLNAIVEAEAGLTPDIQDWLKGNRRMASATTSMAADILGDIANQDI